MSQGTEKMRYFRVCQNDLKSTQGWFGKICLLGLIQLIPIFGQITLYGYSYEWGHQVAWGVKEPLPKKIYGRPGSKMLRWGWFAMVIAFVFGLIPGLVDGLGSFISSMGTATIVTTACGAVSAVGGNPVLVGIGGLIGFIGMVGSLFMWIFSQVGIIRMTMYDRLGTGFQFGKLWAMTKKDFPGLLRIFGMSLLLGLIIGIILTIIAAVVFGLVLGATIAPLAVSSSLGTGAPMTDSAIVGYAMSAALSIVPFVLVFAYVCCVAVSWVQLLVGRAIGYWCQQFDVADWGTKDDPLPFQTAGQQAATSPAPPMGQPVATVTPAPAPAPAEEPVVAEAAAVVVEEPVSSDSMTEVEVAGIIEDAVDDASLPEDGEAEAPKE